MKPLAFALVFLALATSACDREAPRTGEDAADRHLDVERRIRASLADPHERAREQDLAADLVRRVEEALVAVQELQDEPDEELDDVSVNAISAFQRRVGLEDDGMLDERTRRELGEAAGRSLAPAP